MEGDIVAECNYTQSKELHNNNNNNQQQQQQDHKRAGQTCRPSMQMSVRLSVCPLLVVAADRRQFAPARRRTFIFRSQASVCSSCGQLANWSPTNFGAERESSKRVRASERESARIIPSLTEQPTLRSGARSPSRPVGSLPESGRESWARPQPASSSPSSFCLSDGQRLQSDYRAPVWRARAPLGDGQQERMRFATRSTNWRPRWFHSSATASTPRAAQLASRPPLGGK